MIGLRTILFTVLVPGTITVVLPLTWLWSGSEPWPLPLGAARFFGLAPVIGGAAMYARCAWDFTVVGRGTPAPYDPPRELVTHGLYRHVRNPIYLAVLAILAGESLLFQSGVLLAWTAALFLGFHVRVVYREEPTLKRRFGERFGRYCKAVPRWVPRRQPWREPSSE
jgi:protein-S-isoprenylcysteine O-methyltransferase Ste14